MTTKLETAGCASDDALERLHARELTEHEARELRGHLDICTACAERDRRLRAQHETWIVRLRAAGLPPPGAREMRNTTPIADALGQDAVPGYLIEGEIARGGQGVIFRAVHEATRRAVALKVLRDAALASPAERRRFQREIELAADLRHPNIVTIFDAGTTRDGRAYFAMQFVEGLSVTRWVRAAETPQDSDRNRPLLRVFVRICDALAYAHQRGVIHRDLKPSNVLVDAGGEPHVLDFGLARWIHDENSAALSSAANVAGTLPYMSPEQARGLPDATDVRSDVYALGVMLYEALTGTYPYPVETDTVSTLRHIAESAPIPPSHRQQTPAVDDELETIVLKALAKERERRYQSAGELGRDLERYMTGEAIEAKRDSATYLLRKALRRHRGLVTLSAAFVFALAVLAAALAGMYVQQRRLRSQAEARFQQVRELAKTFIFEVDPKIRRLPGASDARQLIVEKGLTYLDALSHDAPADPALQREIAAAYMAIGDTQGDTTTSNTGDSRAAAESYRKGLAILEREGNAALIADAQAGRDVVLGKLRLADVLCALGDLSAARQFARAALDLSETMSQRDPDNDGLLDLHGDALERMGNVAVAEGKPDEAENWYDRAAAIAERRAAAHPDDLWVQRDLGVSYTKRAQLQYARGDKVAALALYRRFGESAERLLASHPDDLVAQRDAAAASQWVGILLLETGHASTALDPFRRSASLSEALMTADAGNADACAQFATTLSRMGEAYLARGDLEHCDGVFRRSFETSRACLARAPEDPSLTRLHGVSMYKLFELQQARANQAATGDERRALQTEACEWLEKCRDWFVDLQTRGKLSAADAGTPAELTGELERCRAQIPAAAPSGSGPRSRPDAASGSFSTNAGPD